MKCIESGVLPEAISEGYKKYKDNTKRFKDKLTAKIAAVVDNDTCTAFIKDKGGLDNLFKEYNKKLTNTDNHDDITCFSAYMLGACGPDFWMVPSKANEMAGIIPNIMPDMASVHFDLGHYNRSHRQFQVAIERWRDNTALSDFQKKVEQSYFYGMATHIATDCVMHQLVNVTAGAYHLLKPSLWKNEHGFNEYGEKEKKPLIASPWNTHNKVEHFWDSYIRYRYLGDTGPLFNPELGDIVSDPDHPGRMLRPEILDKDSWMKPLDFPTTETLIDNLEEEVRLISKLRILQTKVDAKNRLIATLKQYQVKIKIEQPFILPRIFCDRVNAVKDPVTPFIYDIVVKKDKGAYEKDIIFNAAIAEEKHFQMEAGKVGDSMSYNETKKLSLFSTKTNEGDLTRHSFNYLNYIVSPNLKRVQDYGWNNFYHTNALKPFFESSVEAANKFVADLSVGIKTNDPNELGVLGKFWNLDTGQGIEVRNIRSHTSKEVITELNFIHVTELVPSAKISYTHNKKYLKGIPEKNESNEPVKRAFNTYKNTTETWWTCDEISETKQDQYLNRLTLASGKITNFPDCNIKSFFTSKEKSNSKDADTPTETNTKDGATTIKHHDIKHRLTLNFSVPIAEFSPNEHLGFILYNDDTIKVKEASKDIDIATWVKKNKKKIDFIETQDKDAEELRFSRTRTRGEKSGLCVFETQLLINLESAKDPNDPKKYQRKIEKDAWNNVIEYKEHKKHYSRNYAVATCRKNVLEPIYEPSLRAKVFTGHFFKGKRDFKNLVQVFDTEQVFFSLYLLVKIKDKCFDMLSKEEVVEADLKNIKKIDSLGVVKIVLFYEMNDNGAAQLNECMIDGLTVKVTEVNS